MTSSAPQQTSQFLTDSGASAYLEDALVMLAETRPEDPLRALAGHFRALSARAAVAAAAAGPGRAEQAPLERSYQILRTTRPDRDVFMDDLAEAYSLANAQVQRAPPGMTGDELAQLLRRLCADFPVDVTDSVLGALGLSRADAVPFSKFCEGVRAWIAHSDFLAAATKLFASRPRWGAPELLEAVRTAANGAAGPVRAAEEALAGLPGPTGDQGVSLPDFQLALFRALAASDHTRSA